MAKFFGVQPKSGTGKDFAVSTMKWQPFPDSKEALACLKQHYKLYTLTTGSRELAENLAEKLGSSLQESSVHQMLATASLTPELSISSYLKSHRMMA